MKIYLATGNNHKKQEMQQVFNDFTIVIPKDDGIIFNPVENGSSFIENSLIKAKTLWEQVHSPVLADDSGICVDSLNGYPGIYSARYSGKSHIITDDSDKLSSFERNTLLIDELNEVLQNHKELKNNRNCHFVCALVYYYGNDQFLAVQETLEGQIVNSITNSAGKNGFGYDPIVFLPEYNKTVSELSEQEKNDISHRGKACKKLINLLKF